VESLDSIFILLHGKSILNSLAALRSSYLLLFIRFAPEPELPDCDVIERVKRTIYSSLSDMTWPEHSTIFPDFTGEEIHERRKSKSRRNERRRNESEVDSGTPIDGFFLRPLLAFTPLRSSGWTRSPRKLGLTASLLSLWSRPFTRSPRKLGLTASLLSLYLLSRPFTPLPLLTVELFHFFAWTYWLNSFLYYYFFDSVNRIS